MDLIKHVRYFVAVAEEGHFGRAAARLGMAQPSLSQRIQRLEREYGVRLFDRTSRGAELTEGGRLMLAEARPLLERADALEGMAARVRSGAAGLLRAAVPPELDSAVVAALVSGFREGSPGVRLELRERGAQAQLAELAAGSLDAGVLRHPVDVAGLALGEVMSRPLGAVVPDDGSAPAGPLALGELTGRDLVLFPRPSGPALHDEILATCRRHGFEPGTVIAGRDPAFVTGMVLSGTAVAFAPREREVPAGAVWRELAGAPLLERVSSAWLRSRQGDPAVELFAAVVEAALAEYGGMIPVAQTVAAGRLGAPVPRLGFTV
ncbi:LysR family transcriptional regulator [Streptomyces spiroverticillatus]|uniref:LysR family transcriptional regulator n=1 Tax=Streptomyces finlayi TaxID=67296 RepID=A0A918WW44_9ACTN|nr:LysR family transcriptional regulator [Streptomyces finlayi]GHA05375.1 LysR family transcriptional regulator [Streptomyces spiroverticillatus]GHC89249.1 LysR family transcriptional regulator [Streptomyces finlayi]